VRDELAIQLADMTRVNTLSQRLSNSIELGAVLEEVLSAVVGLQGAQRGVLMLHDRERSELRTAAVMGFDADQHTDPARPTPALRLDGETAALLRGDLAGADLSSLPIPAAQLAAASDSGRQACWGTRLLTCGGELVGVVVTTFPQPYRPSERAARLVELYARQAAEFIENARLYREIREADRRKGEFLAMLGHELRNPLAPILNALHVMRLPSLDREGLEQARAIAERQVKHLARLVDDLLDVSRIDRGKIELRKGRVDLREAVSRAIDTTRPLIDGRRHSLSVALPDQELPLEADPTRLEQILANLLNNAAKYTEPGGEIALAVERGRGDYVIKVRDNGNGIDPDLLPRVFEMFTQADCSLDRSQGGLGIGLTLVRRLVQMHGGRVSAHSEGRGRGSEFVIVLPALPSAAEDVGEDSGIASPPQAQGTHPCRVLLVDDNVDGTSVLARLLRQSGHQVDVALDGATALQTARDHRPDVVLLDIGLPGMDGYEVAKRLRAQEGLGEVALVALTGYGQEEDRLRAAEAGFDHHLVKPVDLEVVQEILAHPHRMRRKPDNPEAV
jgi:signal transduction histidine kinase/ActR/RegA family two-component response regulator